MSPTAAATLDTAIAALLAVDPATLGNDDLQRLAIAVAQQQSRLAVAVGHLLAEWESRRGWQSDGSLRPDRALARDTRSRDCARRHQLLLARRLSDMPLTRDAVLAGTLSYDHVELFAHHATPVRMPCFARDEALLVALCAEHLVFADSQRTLTYWAAQVDDELGLERRRPDPSTLYHSTSETTGEGHLDGHLSAVDNEIVKVELARLERAILLEDRQRKVVRTRAQRRAAALVRMAARSVNAEGATARPLLQVIVGDHTARRLCETASGIVLHPDDLAPLIDDAVVEAFLFDGPTTVIAKSSRRTFTGALRAAITVRDRRCQHRSGCDTPAIHGDVDHRRPAARGGPTSQFNGRAECVPHNRLPHLHDHDHERPDREITVLDAIRCRLRWSVHAEVDRLHPESGVRCPD